MIALNTILSFDRFNSIFSEKGAFYSAENLKFFVRRKGFDARKDFLAPVRSDFTQTEENTVLMKAKPLAQGRIGQTDFMDTHFQTV